MKHRENDNLETYYTIFKNILDNLKIRKLVLKIEHMELFLKGLPVRARKRAMRKTSMNFKKLKTIKFNTMCVFMTKKT